MANVIFICEKGVENASVVSYTKEAFNPIVLNFNADSVKQALNQNRIILIAAYLKDISAESQEEFNRLMTEVKTVPFMIIGTREVCRSYYGQTDAIIQKYLFTPVSVGQYLGQFRHVLNELRGISDPVDDSGIVIPVAHRPSHILVVDDDAVYLRTIMNWLKDTYQVSVVKSGPAALAFLAENIPDLILLDYEMPEYDGVHTLGMIRRDSRLNNVPVMFLTGVSDSSMVKDAVQLKPQGYILKSIDKSGLTEKIKEVIKVQ